MDDKNYVIKYKRTIVSGTATLIFQRQWRDHLSLLQLWSLFKVRPQSFSLTQPQPPVSDTATAVHQWHSPGYLSVAQPQSFISEKPQASINDTSMVIYQWKATGIYQWHFHGHLSVTRPRSSISDTVMVIYQKQSHSHLSVAQLRSF